MGRGLKARRACAEDRTTCCVVTFETLGGEVLWEPLWLLSAECKCVPLFVSLAMALQLSREQGITLRGSAEIVAEFFCKSSRRAIYLGELSRGGSVGPQLGL